MRAFGRRAARFSSFAANGIGKKVCKSAASEQTIDKKAAYIACFTCPPVSEIVGIKWNEKVGTFCHKSLKILIRYFRLGGVSWVVVWSSWCSCHGNRKRNKWDKCSIFFWVVAKGELGVREYKRKKFELRRGRRKEEIFCRERKKGTDKRRERYLNW